MNMRLTKDCKHGQLASTCEICAEIEQLVQERDALKHAIFDLAEADKAALDRMTSERDALQLVERGMQSVIDELKTENAQIRELMNCYNLGWWMDSLRLIKERDALSKLADKWNFECDELREDNKRLAAENKVLRDALKTLYLTCPTTLDCRNFHHSKSEEHSYLASCKPAADYEAALKQSREALGETK
mgnify:CR=1 FL=1